MNDDFLDDLILVAKAMDAPPKEPSERARELFEAALARRQPFTVVTEKQMRVIILQILTLGRSDGSEIVAKLHESKVKLELEGEGVIFALLSQMEEDGLLTGQFDPTMTRKTYRVETPGSTLLEKNAATVKTINAPVGALFAT